MGAARFIGRVGGLAVAMGVGAAWFAGGVASADTTGSSARGDRASTQAADDSRSPSASTSRANRPGRTSPAQAAAADDPGPQRHSRPTVVATKPAKPAASTPSTADAVPAVDVLTESDTARPEVVDASSPALEITAPVAEASVEVTEVAPTPAPQGALSALPTGAEVLVDTSAGGGPMVPVDSPLAWALLAAARRQPLAAASTTTAASQVTCYLCVDPSVTWGGTFNGKTYDGALVGTVGVTSALPVNYTVLSRPSLGGKLASSNGKAPSNTVFSPEGEFFYLPYATALTTPDTTESFRILVAQQTDFETFVENLPILGLLAPAVFNLLHQVPIIRDLLQPLIGATEVVTFEVSAYAEAQGRPTAFTVKVPSFDGLMVSTNYYPATNVARGDVTTAPTVFSGPGLGSPGNTDLSNPYGMLDLLPETLVPTPAPDQFGSLNPGLPVLRDGAWISEDDGPSYVASTGFNVVTWDPRGEFATRDRSLPGLQIDNPFWEARDVSALISWLSTTANPARTQITMEDAMTGDPLIGMVGGSYGGGIQWVTAGTDPRVDAIAPEISWNSLISSLYPNQNQFKTGFGTVLLLALVTTGAQINAQIYSGIGSGILTGRLSEASQAMLASAGPTALVGNITVPTLIMQGMQDVLFELNEAVANAQTLPAGTTKKMVWFCGGHGTCTDPLNPFQDDQGLVDNLKWLDQYVAGNGTAAEDIPNFQWYDQMGFYYTSDLLPYENGFNRPNPQTVTGSGGMLGIWPILGGSGPGGVSGVSPVLTIGNASPARNAINTQFTPEPESQIVGAPTLSFTYKGIGTSRTVYGQLIDDTTGKVLGNLVTPIPVKLDGRERTVEIPLANIGYTTTAGGTLTLQITSSASNFENFTSFGVIDISDIRVDLPIRADED